MGLLSSATVICDNASEQEKKSGRWLRGNSKNPVVAKIGQIECPVMGGKANKRIYADHKGKRVYFCCPGCIEKFKEEPDKYIQKLESEGITLDAVPKAQEGNASGHKH